MLQWKASPPRIFGKHNLVVDRGEKKPTKLGGWGKEGEPGDRENKRSRVNIIKTNFIKFFRT